MPPILYVSIIKKNSPTFSFGPQSFFLCAFRFIAFNTRPFCSWFGNPFMEFSYVPYKRAKPLQNLSTVEAFKSFRLQSMDVLKMGVVVVRICIFVVASQTSWISILFCIRFFKKKIQCSCGYLVSLKYNDKHIIFLEKKNIKNFLVPDLTFNS